MWLRVFAVFSLAAGWLFLNCAFLSTAVLWIPEAVEVIRKQMPMEMPPAGELVWAGLILFGLPGALLVSAGLQLWFWAGGRQRYEDEQRQMQAGGRGPDQEWLTARNLVGRRFKIAAILVACPGLLAGIFLALTMAMVLAGFKDQQIAASPTPAEIRLAFGFFISQLAGCPLILAIGAWRIGAAEIRRCEIEVPSAQQFGEWAER